MITIIYGDDSASSRNFYLSERQKIKNPVVLNGEKIELSEVVQILEGEGLFSEHKTLFIEDLFYKKRSTDLKEIIRIIDKNSKENDIFIWEGKELTKAQTAVFKNAISKVFKFPQNLFMFLDSLKPGNNSSILLFHSALKNSEPEIIFFMVVRQIRLLLALQEKADEQIDEVKRLAPWQKDKLQRQSKLFSPEQLKQIYNKLFKIDLKHKTGTNSLTLLQSIDILLLDI